MLFCFTFWYWFLTQCYYDQRKHFNFNLLKFTEPSFGPVYGLFWYVFHMHLERMCILQMVLNIPIRASWLIMLQIVCVFYWSFTCSSISYERGVSKLVLVWLWRMWAGLPSTAAEAVPAIMEYVNGTSWRYGLALTLKMNVSLGPDRSDNIKMSQRPVLNI